ncbi:MAG: isoleucine--tRNA ligase [Verrucomicrobia bacterium]|nr:isoleucine--tRNA ligase [Verrucomicrobiota bacterium]
MNYKDTLNLPKTDFPMRASLVEREPERLKHWENLGIHQKALAKNAGQEKFILHDGPPFANGDVHIGTALNKTLKDMIIKFQSMIGRHAPYVPGWDCHGLPIEFKVSQEMRKNGQDDTDAAAVRSACDAYARKYIQIQKDQFRRLGVFGDWDHPYLTLDKSYEASELRMFADIVSRNMVYRGKKPVYWSIPCRTALADAEVEYKDHVSQSVFVKFPVVDRPKTFILIWTTTPWTLPANLGVAYNSTFSYTAFRVGDELLICSTMLMDKIVETCGLENFDIIRSLTAEDLAGMEYQHPFCQRTGRLYRGDHFVENTTGSGFVHIAPGHGLEDYGVGLENGLPIYSPVDDEGRLARTSDLPESQQMPDSLVGKLVLPIHGRSEANEAVLELLRQTGTLLDLKNYHHEYPHCWRSKTPVIFRAMDQWFIRIDHDGFRQQALKEIDSVQWIPAWGKNRIVGAVTNRPDWCISRQRTWGVPIPVFFAGDEAILDAEIIRQVADLIEEHGSNIWFQLDVQELWSLVQPAGYDGPVPDRKSTDTLDVWIDSGSSSRAVLQARSELSHPDRQGSGQWQADMYLEGSDQHRGWFQSSLLISLAGNGAAPYKTVLTHGFMVDLDRQKISKSKESGYVKPQTAEAYISEHGADIVRLWVASQDFRNDIVVDSERIKKVSEAYRGIRNALRYQLSNLYDFDPLQHTVRFIDMTPLDRWILSRFAALEKEVHAAYLASEFHIVYQKLTQFTAVELSSLYHDLVKDRLYSDVADTPRRRSSQSALYHLVKRYAQWLSPILVFTSDEAWGYVPGHDPETSCIHLANLESGEDWVVSSSEEDYWKSLFAVRQEALGVLELARRDKVIGKALEAVIVVAPEAKDYEVLMRDPQTFMETLNVSRLVLVQPDSGPVVEMDGIPIDFPPGTRILVKHYGDFGAVKCSRCWHWEKTVGQNPEHPELCHRCLSAV